MKLCKVLLVFFLIPAFGAVRGQTTQVVYLSGRDADHTVNWDFLCTDGMNSNRWTTIAVPSNWELQGFGNYNYGLDLGVKGKKIGPEHGLYRHRFEVPGSWKGKTINIVFDGSMTDTRVMINGKPAGDLHQGAFYRFKYDITRLLKYGKTNLLEVDVAKHSANESVNKAERLADFWIFGGIFRPVFLEILPATFMKRISVDAKADGSFRAFVTLNRSDASYRLSVQLSDQEGNVIGRPFESDIEKGSTENRIEGKFENIKSWNPERPQLYNLKFSLRKDSEVLHESTERIGFRTVELRRHDGFYINGERIVFKGVNRHSFRPETGRSLSDADHLTDIRLIKEMNMNAVRCSHYPPDKRFLDLCDSLGLFVLDEITGWQDNYDTIIGPKLIREAILKDENHPSVVIWDHGNEGGWNFANEKAFHDTDIQQRPVIYPWLLHNGADTYHYPAYNFATGRYAGGNDPFMPTEMLHGLYDGGLGAGLDDYWKNYTSSPLGAGGFLWALIDEAVLRTDNPGTVYDSDGNHGPDGILGPHREKEGSFYTIKEIWSPVQPEPVIINKLWNGKLFLANKYLFTNLNQCSFSWRMIKTGDGDEKLLASGNFTGPDTRPGETGSVYIDCHDAVQKADIFEFTALGPKGEELYTWSRPVIGPDEKAQEMISGSATYGPLIDIKAVGDSVIVALSDLKITFSSIDGTLLSVKNRNGIISLSGGPVPAGVNSQIKRTYWDSDDKGNFRMTVLRSVYPGKMTWTLEKNGLLKLEASPLQDELRDIEFVGISFNYPEEKCRSVRWMGDGPYRVWKNRIKGSRFGVWEKAYNNTVTGESFNNLIYPEFKGYHGNLYWLTLATTESPFTIISGTPGLFFQLFKPAKPQYVAGGTFPPFPDGDISFLYDIPPIGTKFKQADQLGPQSQKGIYSGHKGDENYPVVLWFDFRAK